MNAIRVKTAAEQRLEWIEGLRRPLTDAESEELRRCLHAIYMRKWRLANAVSETGWDEFAVEREAKREVNEIATRMEEAVDPDWPKPTVSAPIARTWQDKARHGSECLCDAIKAAGVHP